MITLIPYNPLWAQWFQEERNYLLQAMGNSVAVIEHIGSTSIPDICAKPVIDIMIGVHDLKQFTDLDIKKITALGYEYISAYEVQLPNRRFFQKDDSQGRRTHQIHLVNYPSSWWNRHILFRDYLLNHPEAAKAYEAHKLELAEQFDDTNQYANAKTKFCQKIDQLAYFDFDTHRPWAETENLYGYIPQLGCLHLYRQMFQDPVFVDCFGVCLSDERIAYILQRDVGYWDKYGFAPLVWFDKENHNFVGEGGLNHSKVEGTEVIELTYSLVKDYWGKGFAVEIGRYAIEQAFQKLKLTRIFCFTMPSNHQSLRVMRKLGFQYQKDFIHAELPHQLYLLESV